MKFTIVSFLLDGLYLDEVKFTFNTLIVLSFRYYTSARSSELSDNIDAKVNKTEQCSI